jgi:hypothetical protein
VQVVERMPSVDSFDRSKGFMYSVDARGLQLLALVGLAEQLPALSVPTSEFRLAYVTPEDGVKAPISLPIKDDGKVRLIPLRNCLSHLWLEELCIEPRRLPLHHQVTNWLPRHVLVKLMYDAVLSQKADAPAHVMLGACVTSFERVRFGDFYLGTQVEQHALPPRERERDWSCTAMQTLRIVTLGFWATENGSLSSGL